MESKKIFRLGHPVGELMEQINKDFGLFDNLNHDPGA